MIRNHWLLQLSQRWFLQRDRSRHRSLRRALARTRRRTRLSLEVLEDRFLLSGTIIDLGTLPGDTGSGAYGINDAGQVVEASVNSGVSHTFRWLRNLFIDHSRKDRRRLAARNRKPVRLFLEQLESRLTPSAPTLSTLAFFNDIGPTGLIMDNSGNLYGTTGSGGASNEGRIIELAKGSSTITTLASFNGTNGAAPTGLIMDGSGNLYGTTKNGGASEDGTVFELSKGNNNITTLASFSGTNGESPNGGLIMDGSGNLYGTTEFGGASKDGTVFELASGSSTIATLASFNGTNGQNPVAGLIMDSSGNLYGTTDGGGTFDKGTVFELAKGSSTITTLASFNGTNGAFPQTGLLVDGSGNLYGTTSGDGTSNGGTVFELTQGSSTITTLASVNSTNGSLFPSNLLMDGSGNLYGTTSVGGASGGGTVFDLAKGSSTINTLASIAVTNGASPSGGLIMDSSGNLYGTTSVGGASNDGTVFELAKGSSTITTLASFNGTNGSGPEVGLIMDSSGDLYGTTSGGGASGEGTVFELAKGSSTITTLASFNGTNGANPDAGLIMDGSGNLYGTTVSGGASSFAGTVFELAKGSSTTTTLASFNGTNGSGPTGLIMDSSGNLYGTTSVGGNSDDGTVFELAKGSSTITTLASFNGTNGQDPSFGLIMDGNGNLYGTTSGGGNSDDGTVFELAKGSSTITTLASFNGTNGSLPSGLIMDSSGNLYGTTFGGSASNDGTVFELAKGSSTITALASFNGTNGASPVGGLIVDSSSNLYGTTVFGGSADEGTIFELQTSLNGNKAPVITGQPSSQTVTASSIVSFTASASGTPTPIVQWQVSTDGGKTFTDLSNGANASGATSTTLTLRNVTTDMSGYEYQAVFSNSAGSKTTNAATLTVSQSPPPLPSPPVSPAPPALNVPPLLALFDSLLAGTETVNANGTETITDSLFGIPLLVSTFDSHGNLESVLFFGINVTLLFELL